MLKLNLRDWKYVPFYNFLSINAVGFFLLFLTYFNGWAETIYRSDSTNIVVVILALFVYGLIICGVKIQRASDYIILLEDSDFTKNIDVNYKQGLANKELCLAESIKQDLFGNINFIKWIANSLVTLGLIGTVIGFIIAFSAIDAASVGDVDKVGQLVAGLTNGMGIALYTTLTGAAFNLWLNLNYFFTNVAVNQVILKIIEKKNV